MVFPPSTENVQWRNNNHDLIILMHIPEFETRHGYVLPRPLIYRWPYAGLGGRVISNSDHANRLKQSL